MTLRPIPPLSVSGLRGARYKGIEAIEIIGCFLASLVPCSGYATTVGALLPSHLLSPAASEQLFGPLFGSNTATRLLDWPKASSKAGIFRMIMRDGISISRSGDVD
ncbi:hypothetical protein C8J56DRAFT_899992 [Mycena floridula]|nr:hypothetical protein C8J56DRAFT_899992 [Mycena floridula]